jgi:hypothetical protein
VIGLDLCPFAGHVVRENRLRIRFSSAVAEEEVLTDLQEELMLLAASDPAKIETTLLCLPELSGEFEDFNELLGLVDLLLEDDAWRGRFQVASFHPGYRFAGTRDRDPGNLTNRSPVPVLHILRESSVAAAVDTLADPASIPARNITVMESLDRRDQRRLFPWLFRDG